ncbi:MAG: hypothetical protein COB16_19485 [Rhodobacteraceae bacterium]|nr:MAG: hypothetical protein COB16_19485 [Paracoccaceae bacterium]
MSNHITSLLRRKILGVGLTGKSVILLMGDLASDDGSGIWASKARMARELETTDRTIQRTIKALIDAGFVSCVGERRHQNGSTFEYQINADRVDLCADAHDKPPTHRHPLAQHLGAKTQDVTPDAVSPPTEGHPTPDAVSPHAPTEGHPNQTKPNRTNCAADAAHNSDFDFVGFLSKFASVYPRMGDAEKTEDALRSALGEGADPKDILAGARAYAVEQDGNEARYIKFSENWISDGRWHRHVTAPSAKIDVQKTLAARAATILEAKPFICRSITAYAAGECIVAGLVSVDQCKAAGINL